jgi:hypothetical protein
MRRVGAAAEPGAYDGVARGGVDSRVHGHDVGRDRCRAFDGDDIDAIAAAQALRDLLSDCEVDINRVIDALQGGELRS